MPLIHNSCWKKSCQLRPGCLHAKNTVSSHSRDCSLTRFPHCIYHNCHSPSHPQCIHQVSLLPFLPHYIYHNCPAPSHPQCIHQVSSMPSTPPVTSLLLHTASTRTVHLPLHTAYIRTVPSSPPHFIYQNCPTPFPPHLIQYEPSETKLYLFPPFPQTTLSFSLTNCGYNDIIILSWIILSFFMTIFFQLS